MGREFNGTETHGQLVMIGLYRLSPDDQNCCVSKLQLLAYGSTSYVASSSMKYAHQVPDRPEQISFLWSGYLSAMDKGHLQPLTIMISLKVTGYRLSHE